MEEAWKNVERLGAEVGLTLRPSEHRGPSRLALEGAKFAADHGAGEAYHMAVFKAHFEAGKDISDAKTLVSAGRDAGLDPAALESALKERRYRQAVLDDEAQAASWGITAIPCFVYDGRGVMGVQSEQSLESLLHPKA